jgi:hypothetical protein
LPNASSASRAGGEIGYAKPLIGLAAFVVILSLHPCIFGVRRYWRAKAAQRIVAATTKEHSKGG